MYIKTIGFLTLHTKSQLFDRYSLRAIWQTNININVLIIIIPNCAVLSIIRFTNVQSTLVLLCTYNFNQLHKFCPFDTFISQFCNIKGLITPSGTGFNNVLKEKNPCFAHPIIFPSMFCSRERKGFACEPGAIFVLVICQEICVGVVE